MAPMAVVGAQGAEYVESDEMLLRVCSDKELSLAMVVEAAACDAASGTYTDDQGRLALHHACAHAKITAEILAATPGDRFAKDISGDAPVEVVAASRGGAMTKPVWPIKLPICVAVWIRTGVGAGADAWAGAGPAGAAYLKAAAGGAACGDGRGGKCGVRVASLMLNCKLCMCSSRVRA